MDYNEDEYVDDFDLFLDALRRQRRRHGCLQHGTLAAAAGHGALGEEFSGIDDQLSRLIDDAQWPIVTATVKSPPATPALATTTACSMSTISTRRCTAASASPCPSEAWEAAHGDSYQTVVQGPDPSPGSDEAPVTFEMTDEEMLEISTAMFDESQTLVQRPKGVADFLAQAAAQDGVGTAEIVPVVDGVTSAWESVPYEAPGRLRLLPAPGVPQHDVHQRAHPASARTHSSRTASSSASRTWRRPWIAITTTGTMQAPVEPVVDPETLEVTYELRFRERPHSRRTSTPVRSWPIRAPSPTTSASRTARSSARSPASKPNEYAHWRNKIAVHRHHPLLRRSQRRRTCSPSPTPRRSSRMLNGISAGRPQGDGQELDPHARLVDRRRQLHQRSQNVDPDGHAEGQAQAAPSSPASSTFAAPPTSSERC